jgi:hypothetical protein
LSRKKLEKRQAWFPIRLGQIIEEVKKYDLIASLNDEQARKDNPNAA